MKTPTLPVIVLVALTGSLFLMQSSATVTFDWVRVGDINNAVDPTDGDRYSPGVQNFGSVSYDYNIGKYEVTNGQYAEFLNAADPTGVNPYSIYAYQMGGFDHGGGIVFNASANYGTKYTVPANMGNKPVNFVSWFDAARFTNWIHNGQGAGSTENGVYNLNGASSGIFTRESGATIWIPTEDEWYKAAYYQAAAQGGDSDNYWLYPTRSNSAPTIATADAYGNISNPGANVANCQYGSNWNGVSGMVTTVGSAGDSSTSYFGTFDQGGNLLEWTDGIDGFSRILRGGDWAYSSSNLQSGYRGIGPPEDGYNTYGFRLAAVPEPSVGLSIMTLLTLSLTFRRRAAS